MRRRRASLRPHCLHRNCLHRHRRLPPAPAHRRRHARRPLPQLTTPPPPSTLPQCSIRRGARGRRPPAARPRWRLTARSSLRPPTALVLTPRTHLRPPTALRLMACTSRRPPTALVLTPRTYLRPPTALRLMACTSRRPPTALV